MYAVIAAYVATNVTAAIKRQAVIYSIYAVGALLVIFAGGYGVDALYTLAVFRFGALMASLIVAGCFIVVAIVMFAVAYLMSHRTAPRAANSNERLYSTPPHYSRGAVAFAAGALAAAAATSAIIAKRFRTRT